MPELPEVESIRRGLVRARLREPVEMVWRSRLPLRHAKQWRPEALKQLAHCRPGRVWRRGKLMLWAFEPPGDLAMRGLMIHLGMTGHLDLVHAREPRVLHTHLILRFADGRELRFVDPRRFGALRAGLLNALRCSPPWSALGPEPLASGFDGRRLQARAGRSQRAIRDVLLDQTVVAGVGNIYAVEALFEARIGPLTPAIDLDESAWRRLARAIQSVLRRGLRHGGTTLKDFRDVTGEPGRNQNELRVYGREDQPCPRCGVRLRRFMRGGRSGAYCPGEQM